jgi:hypothetical protein
VARRLARRIRVLQADDALIRDIGLGGFGVVRVKARTTEELLEKIRELREALK